jgi:hypothetical protein
MRCHCLCTCDGYHTFDELYDQRSVLYIALCKRQSDTTPKGWWSQVWRSKTHSDGTSYPGWFVLGIGKAEGHQLTFHLHESWWDSCEFAAPEFDGHTVDDVIERLKRL